MTAFCMEAIHPDATLRAEHGVLRVAALAVASDARVAARRILEQARADADALTQAASARARELEMTAQRQTVERAAALLHGLEQLHATYLERAQDIVIGLAQGLYERLVLESTPSDRVLAALRRLQLEAPSKLVSPVLRVHPDDAASLPELEWDIKPDAAMPRGACRLEAATGEWRAEFDVAAEALRAAFTRAIETPPPADNL